MEDTGWLLISVPLAGTTHLLTRSLTHSIAYLPTAIRIVSACPCLGVVVQNFHNVVGTVRHHFSNLTKQPKATHTHARTKRGHQATKQSEGQHTKRGKQIDGSSTKDCCQPEYKVGLARTDRKKAKSPSHSPLWFDDEEIDQQYHGDRNYSDSSNRNAGNRSAIQFITSSLLICDPLTHCKQATHQRALALFKHTCMHV